MISGLVKIKKDDHDPDSGNDGLGQVKKEPAKWQNIIADLAIILKKFPGEVARNMTLYQAIAVREADYRHKQFIGGVHGVRIPDKDTPRTEDGRAISTVDDLFGAMRAGMGA